LLLFLGEAFQDEGQEREDQDEEHDWVNLDDYKSALCTRMKRSWK
jgi:hypothetical protein